MTELGPTGGTERQTCANFRYSLGSGVPGKPDNSKLIFIQSEIVIENQRLVILRAILEE